jgi:putative ABC transport system permease protein
MRLGRISLRAISRNKIRALLSILGIAIGIGAMVSMVAVGEGASARIHQAIASLGARMIWVEAGGVNVRGVRTGGYGTKTLIIQDAEAIRAQIPLVKYISPQVDTRVQLVYGNQNWNSMVRGVSPEFLDMREWPIAVGDPFTDQDVSGRSKVCLLGQTIVDRLFGGTDPIGQTIRVKGLPIRVIGVLARKGAAATGQDQDDTFIMPYTTVQTKIKGQYWLDDILCSAVSEADYEEAKNEVIALIRQRHHIAAGAPDDFNLRDPTEIAQAVAETSRTMTLLLTSIASISLLVGGIGIMNIMLVSVTERTREIGIRMSVGARTVDIWQQFPFEAVTLGIMGGLLGFFVGTASAAVIRRALQWPVQVSPLAFLLAFGFSVCIGVLFGFYPAHKASRMNPVDALRFEV